MGLNSRIRDVCSPKPYNRKSFSQTQTDRRRRKSHRRRRSNSSLDKEDKRKSESNSEIANDVIKAVYIKSVKSHSKEEESKKCIIISGQYKMKTATVLCTRSQHGVVYVSMTTLLTHTVAHFTKPSFMTKTNNQPLKKFLSLSLS